MAKDPASDLYALPLDEFTGARNALAKELAAGGDKDAAAEVRALKKPGVPAWAVNQVARAYPEAVESLFEAGALLRDAQKKLIRSGDAAAVKEATAAERKAVRDLVDRARKILSDAGHTPNEALLERVADTFYATTVDDEGREAVRNGTRACRNLNPTVWLKAFARGLGNKTVDSASIRYELRLAGLPLWNPGIPETALVHLPGHPNAGPRHRLRHHHFQRHPKYPLRSLPLH